MRALSFMLCAFSFSMGTSCQIVRKIQQEVTDKQLVLNQGYWNCHRFPHGSWISGCFSLNLDFRIRFDSL